MQVRLNDMNIKESHGLNQENGCKFTNHLIRQKIIITMATIKNKLILCLKLWKSSEPIRQTKWSEPV